MSTKHPTQRKRTDPRANYLHAGVDTDGSHHVYRTIDETIHVITPAGDREHVEQLDGRSVHEWMAFVADVRGWTEQYLVDSFGDALEQATDTDGGA